MLTGGLIAPPAVAKPRPTWVAYGDLEFTPELRRVIDLVGAAYYKRTRRELVVTSGYRPPKRQAAAMYVKLRSGGSLAIYRDQRLVQPILAAYRQGRKKRLKRDEIIGNMAQIIASQVADGHHISRHLLARCFDVRTRGLTRKQHQAFAAAVAEVGGMRVLHERKPPHYHIEIVSMPEALGP